MSPQKSFYIVDGNSLLYRAFYAIKGLSTKTGFPTNAIYGFYTMLNKLLEEKKPDYILVAFDVSRKSFRNDIYRDYKAQRPPMPESLLVQLPYIKKILRALNIATVELENYEADDIIGTLTYTANKEGINVVVVTGDKDLYQLINDKTLVYNPSKEEFFNREKTKEFIGVYPEEIPDFLALQGDPVDNIPGVKGIGKKTAAKLIEEFGSIENLIKNLDSIKPEKIRKKIEEGKELLFIGRRLTEVKRDLELNFDLEKFRFKEPDRKLLSSIFKELEFYSLLNDINESSSGFTQDYRLIGGEAELEEIVKKIFDKKQFAFDTETTSEKPIEAEIVGISIGINEGEAYYINLYKTEGKERFLQILKPIFEDESIAKIGHNLKYDILVFKPLGIDVKGKFFDTMLMSYLLTPNRRHHKLDDLSIEYLNYKPVSYKELVGKGKNEKKIYEVSVDELVFYACEDSDIALRLKNILLKKLKEEDLYRVYTEIEEPLIKVLVEMEHTGVKVDVERLKSLSMEIGRRLKQLEEEIYRVSGFRFNINSPKQLAEILFEKLKLPVLKKTKKSKSFSTSMDVLLALRKRHPLVNLILEYRKLSKIKSTYTDSLLDLVNKKTGRIHTSYNQTVAATGRLSSSDPNLQNIPIKDELGKKIREAFVAGKENLLLSADYSQIELRVLAHFSEDPILMKAYKEGKDIHSYTAEKVFDKEGELSPEEKRRRAKIINFSIIYGKTAHGLSEELGISHEEAQKFIDSYFNEFKGVKVFIEKVMKEAQEKGFVKTLFGRRRDIPEIRSQDKNIKKQGERIAINSIIQGTAADIIKIAMIKIFKILKKEGFKTRMIMQVHDELVFEVYEKELDGVKKIVKREMENCCELKVPLLVNISTGKTWGKA